jgi:hypothetical protein
VVFTSGLLNMTAECNTANLPLFDNRSWFFLDKNKFLIKEIQL